MSEPLMDFRIEPIGILRTCFPEKFGIPRQPLLAPSAKGQLILHAPYNHPDCVAGLEQVSHVWLSFVFHQHTDKGWKPKVRPPRLGGNEKMGVFATRSSFRPNHLGLSVVKLDSMTIDQQQVCLHLSGVDLVDGTPIVDIKPYVPYVDSIPSAVNHFACEQPALIQVMFSPEAQTFCEANPQHDALLALITEVLQQNPKPAYHSNENRDRTYGMALAGCNVRWCYQHDNEQEYIYVTIIE